LGNPFLRQATWDIERTLFLPKSESSIRELSQKPVYISGLARSGTTILLKLLHSLPEFASLTYRDMPFVMCPNLWGRVDGLIARYQSPTDRAHGDGLAVDLDSPEAFEEVFWCHQAPSPKAGALPCPEPTERDLIAFADFRALAVLSNAKRRKSDQLSLRYLSKNNNNVARISSLARQQDARFLFAVRDPVQTASSLHRMHVRFCSILKKDGFGRQYMSWLNHWEFGPNHRPFAFAVAKMNPKLNPLQPDYWLDYWLAFHDSLILEVKAHANVAVVCHEDLRAQPSHVLAETLEWLGTPISPVSLKQLSGMIERRNDVVLDFDGNLVKKACETYQHWVSEIGFGRVHKV
jgi:Sulfotransferase family